MLTTDEIRAIAQKVVDMSKNTARVDTGALKRSISYTVIKNVVTFRMLYYGQFGTNAKLEKNADRLMPTGTEWKIIYTQFGGGTYEVGRTKSGRRSQKSLFPTLSSIGTSSIRNLINRVRGKKKNEGTD